MDLHLMKSAVELKAMYSAALANRKSFVRFLRLKADEEGKQNGAPASLTGF